MSKYSLYNFSQKTVNEIKQNGSEWSLDKLYYDEFLVELPKLVQKFDLSEIITKVDYPSKHVSIFNAVGNLAPYTQLAKWVENAIKDEQQGKNANHQWKTIKAVLEEAQNQGIDYCSLVRNYKDGKNISQGDQILKLLEKNLQATKNHEIKSEIFNLILEEANKGEYGLYAIPDHYKNNPNVKHAAAKHQEFVNSDKLLVLGVRWDSIEAEENVNAEDVVIDIENREENGVEDNILGMPINGLATLINAGVQTLDGSTNPQDTQGRSIIDLFTQANDLAKAVEYNMSTLANPQNTNNVVSGEQPSTSSNTANSNRVELKVEESINKINKLIQNYKIVISEEYINRVLETEDAKTIDQALNKPYAIKQALKAMIKEITNDLPKYYENLLPSAKSFFKGSEICSNYNKLTQDIRSIDTSLSDDLRYPLAKIIVNTPKNPFEQLAEMFRGESDTASVNTLNSFITDYENTHSNTPLSGSIDDLD